MKLRVIKSCDKIVLGTGYFEIATQEPVRRFDGSSEISMQGVDSAKKMR
jgi:hypothetical protein